MQHRAERAMTPTTVRAGSSSGTMWLGGVLAFAGLMTALSSTAMFVQGEPLGAVVTVLVGIVMLMGGVALFLLAKRACARIDGRGVSWSTMLGARGFVPWEHVHHVSVPGKGDPGGAVCCGSTTVPWSRSRPCAGRRAPTTTRARTRGT